VTAGVAASDGDLMPVRFAGHQRCNAGEWARDFSDYIAIRHIPTETAHIVLRNRLIGVARQWYEWLPSELALLKYYSASENDLGTPRRHVDTRLPDSLCRC